MKIPVRFLLLSLLAFGLVTARAQNAVAKPGYTVLVEISYDEKGVAEGGVIVQSDDPTGDHTLEQIAMGMLKQDRVPPRVVDGKPVKFKARRPFNFPVDDDQGAASNADRPVLKAGQQPIPVYPPALAAAGQTGGAIAELVIREDGSVKSVRILRASHPEFGQAVEEAVRNWVFNPRSGPGRPVESTWRVAVGFTIAGRNVDLKWRLAPRPGIGGIIVGHAPPENSANPSPKPAPDAAVPQVPAEKK